MRWHDKFYHRFRSMFRRNAVEEDLRQELRFHLERQVAENMAAGMSRDEALRGANPVLLFAFSLALAWGSGWAWPSCFTTPA